MSDWRSIPHPEYGNYGGKFQNGKDHTLPPVDWMDQEFANHDVGLKLANNKKERHEADFLLLRNLKAGSSEGLSRPIRGNLYRILAIMVFQILHWIR